MAEHAADAVLWPALANFLPDYPDIKVEVNVNYGMTNIVAERYDAGVRLGDQVEKDMVAVRIGPDFRMAVIEFPSYFSKQVKTASQASSEANTLRTPGRKFGFSTSLVLMANRTSPSSRP